MKYLLRPLVKRTVLFAPLIVILSGVLMPSMVSALSTGDVEPWQATTSLPAGIDAAGSTEYNGYVYTVTGSGANNNIYYAKLNSDGSVGTWTTSSNPISGADINRASAVASNGYLYELGGYDGSVTLNTVYYAPVNANGSVGTWTTSGNTLPASIESATATIHDGYVYLFGGNTNGSVNSAAVYYAKLNSDGSVGTWTTSSNPLPVATRRLTSTLVGNYVYVIGGVQGTYTNTVYYAKLNSDGSVGTWTTSSNTLPAALEQLTAVAYGSYVYALGGDNGGGSVSTVYYAPVNSDGSIGAWVAASNPLPDTFSTSTSVAYNGFIYELGAGTTNGAVVDYAEVVAPPVVASDPTSAKSTTPDTGYGTPSQTLPYVTALILGSIISIGVGLLVLYRSQRKAAER